MLFMYLFYILADGLHIPQKCFILQFHSPVQAELQMLLYKVLVLSHIEVYDLVLPVPLFLVYELVLYMNLDMF